MKFIKAGSKIVTINSQNEDLADESNVMKILSME
jgi:hypothetical protein